MQILQLCLTRMKGSLHSRYTIDVSMNLPSCSLPPHLFTGSAAGPPAKDPDLNVIDHVWGLMVGNMAEDLRHAPGRLSADQLWERVSHEWERLRRRPGYFANLAASMSRRLRDVVAAEGGYTRY